MSLQSNQVTDTLSPTTGALSVTGSVKLTGPSHRLFLKSGSNAGVGTATLVNGTVTVSNTSITANSLVFTEVIGGTLTNLGLRYVTMTPGTGFTITSMNVLDGAQLAYFIVEVTP